jgi:hypothetical protein
MSAFGLEGFASIEAVEVELYTSAYRITGTVHTPFRRVAEILNQLPGAYLTLEAVTIIEHAAAKSIERMPTAHVAIDQVLVLLAHGLGGQPRAEMRIQKQPAPARLSIPPLRLEGTIHVPVGSRPIDGLLNVPDRFLPMTDATLSSFVHPQLDRQVPILALPRDRAHVITVIEAGGPDVEEADQGGGASQEGPAG